jgi:hypothetical protein
MSPIVRSERLLRSLRGLKTKNEFFLLVGRHLLLLKIDIYKKYFKKYGSKGISIKGR